MPSTSSRALAGGGERDAVSLLDQVLVTAVAVIDEALGRYLLGLRRQASVDRFIGALAHGDALAGIDVLDALEGEGRDLVSFSDQVVTRLRERLIGALAQPASPDTAVLAGAARRLTGIDASRSGLGGYRWQLELALLAASLSPTPVTGPAVPARAPSPTPVTGPAVPARAPSPTPDRPAAARPAPTATPTAPLESMPAGSDLLDDLWRRWPEIVAWVGRNPANKPLVENCRPVEVRDGFVILGFPEDQPFLREKAEQRRSHHRGRPRPRAGPSRRGTLRGGQHRARGRAGRHV